MGKRLSTYAALALAVVLVAEAGAVPLASLPGAMTGTLPGTVARPISGEATLVHSFLTPLTATVEYAVFLPGDFPFASFGETDPSGGTELVYAYRLVSPSGNSSILNNGALDFSKLSIGLREQADGGTDEAEDPDNEGFIDDGGVAPTSVELNNETSPGSFDNVLFTWEDGPIDPNNDPGGPQHPGYVTPGSQSNILIYTSPFMPEADAASVTYTGVIFNIPQQGSYGFLAGDETTWVASPGPTPGGPVPEPSSILLVGIALAVTSMRRSR